MNTYNPSKYPSIKDSSKVRPMPGHVLVRPDGMDGLYDKTKGGLNIDTDFNPGQHAVVTGEIISVCGSLPFHAHKIRDIKASACAGFDFDFDSKKLTGCTPKEDFRGNLNEVRELTAKSMMYDVPIEAKPGDGVLFNYGVWLSLAENGWAFFCDKTESLVITMPYDMLKVIIRGDGVIPVNGFAIAKPSRKYQEVSAGGIIGPTPDRELRMQAVVTHVGVPSKGYKGFFEPIAAPDGIKPGDHIIYNASQRVPLEFSLHRKFFEEEMLILHQKDILAVWQE